MEHKTESEIKTGDIIENFNNSISNLEIISTFIAKNDNMYNILTKLVEKYKIKSQKAKELLDKIDICKKEKQTKINEMNKIFDTINNNLLELKKKEKKLKKKEKMIKKEKKEKPNKQKDKLSKQIKNINVIIKTIGEINKFDVYDNINQMKDNLKQIWNKINSLEIIFDTKYKDNEDVLLQNYKKVLDNIDNYIKLLEKEQKIKEDKTNIAFDEETKKLFKDFNDSLNVVKKTINFFTNEQQKKSYLLLQKILNEFIKIINVVIEYTFELKKCEYTKKLIENKIIKKTEKIQKIIKLTDKKLKNRINIIMKDGNLTNKQKLEELKKIIDPLIEANIKEIGNSIKRLKGAIGNIEKIYTNEKTYINTLIDKINVLKDKNYSLYKFNEKKKILKTVNNSVYEPSLDKFNSMINTFSKFEMNSLTFSLDKIKLNIDTISSLIQINYKLNTVKEEINKSNIKISNKKVENYIKIISDELKKYGL